MKYFIIILALLSVISCGHRIPKPYRKMLKRVERRERIEEKNRVMSELDDSSKLFKWRPITDSTLLGTPKLLK
jgi:hypothetical protein